VGVWKGAWGEGIGAKEGEIGFDGFNC